LITNAIGERKHDRARREKKKGRKGNPGEVRGRLMKLGLFSLVETQKKTQREKKGALRRGWEVKLGRVKSQKST